MKNLTNWEKRIRLHYVLCIVYDPNTKESTLYFDSTALTSYEFVNQYIKENKKVLGK